MDALLGDAGRARAELGWEAQVPFEELVREMIDSDLSLAERDALVAREGYTVYNHRE